MSIRRYSFGDLVRRVNDDIDIFHDFIPPLSFSFNGRLVDEDEYDIVPKQKTVEKLIRRKEEEIEANERDRDASNKYYEERKKRLIEEKERLLGQRK
jgi:hypothetical protein